MSINYIDTATMYFTFPIQLNTVSNLQMPKPWRYQGTAKDTNLHHWFLKQDKSFMAFYPNMHGYIRLFVTYSVPKFLNGANTFAVTDFDEGSFFALIQKETSLFPWGMPPFNTVNAPSSFKDWDASRIDLFLMHEIPVEDVDEYMGAYELLVLPRYRQKKYKNTLYNNSSKKPEKKSNKVFRIYPKAQEIHDRLINSDYPLAVHKKHEAYLQMNEEPTGFIRFEWMMRRNVLKYECKKLNVQPTMHGVFNQTFQETVLSKFISAIGLDLHILCKRDYKNKIKTLFKTNKTYQNALTLAREIRNNKSKSIPLKKSQIAYIKKVLKQNGIHYITTSYKSLNPVMLKP